MLKFDRVFLDFGHQNILHDISFEVHPGEMVAVLGISGAGKSSLFRLLTGEQHPTKGNVFLDEVRLVELTPSSMQ